MAELAPQYFDLMFQIEFFTERCRHTWILYESIFTNTEFYFNNQLLNLIGSRTDAKNDIESLLVQNSNT